MEVIRENKLNCALVLNDHSSTIFNEIKSSLESCNKFYFNIAFINYGGFQLFIKTMEEISRRNVTGKIITSTYLNFTEPKALRKIMDFPLIELKVYGDVKTRGFHSKAYIFEYDEYYKIIIGSANMTSSALKNNIEWNVKIVSKKTDAFSDQVISEFTKLWDSVDEISEEFLERYDAFIKTIKAANKIQRNFVYNQETTIKANSMQKQAMIRLNAMRNSGEDKGLVIAATGTGKTYMSAFDVLQYKPQKVLFMVHREEILRNAEESFKRVLGKGINTGLYVGKRKDDNAKFLFSTMQTMNKNFEMFDRDEFDYIIIDEAHHVTNTSYQKMLKYFKPKFLLGMTATPERSDGEDIFEQFDNNVAIEVRLQEALEDELIVPFHYFGITDIDSIDLSNVKLDDIGELSKRLKVNERVEFIIEQMKMYGYQGETLKCLAFCVSKDHANYMSEEFNKRGIMSVCLTGDDRTDIRTKFIKRLEDEQDPLSVIFTVDIFNEGIDIPSTNMVLLLRPTNSPIVFIQQLGRGLRKYEDKEYLTVLDFIGNYNRAYLIAIALKGSRYYDKDSLKVSVHNDFSDLPGEVYVQMDQIAKERILEQLNNENFQKLKYLKDEYISFKILNRGEVPFLMTDYLKYEGAPDPLRYVRYSGTYIQFLTKMENGINFDFYLFNLEYMKALKFLSDMLPLKRPHDFTILRALISKDHISYEECKNKIQRYTNGVTESSVRHAIATLNFEYYDTAQSKKWSKLIDIKNSQVVCSDIFRQIKSSEQLLKYFEDILNFGLLHYENTFENYDYCYPFLKLYKSYTMQEIALLSEYTKKHSSFRGSGLLRNNKEFFLFVDLNKNEDIKESVNYKDRFIDSRTFQWESPNKTTQDSKDGQSIIFNKQRSINLHLFIRKFSEVDGVSQPYIYFGKANTISYKGNKPIRTVLLLENEVPINLYSEIITVVK